ncbi:hypothetical protein B1H10_01695 [candidate division KSB1 bacterium 4484_188]|nr:MAG: hypothetical protein B1H10_01695 [candidate division KSB1 bacterium 4484_188]
MTFFNILIVRTDRIGDVVLTTPAIKLLHAQYPSARISFLTRKYSASLLYHHQYLDGVILYQPEEKHRGFMGHLRLGKELKEKSFDLAFLMYPTPGLALSLWMAEIPFRIGTGFRWYSFLFNKKIYEHRKYGLRHELEYNLALLGDFIPKIPQPDEIEFSLRVDENLINRRTDALLHAEIDGKYIIVHPGSGNSAPKLPVETFSRIVSYLSSKTDATIIIAGNKSEEPLLGEIKSHQRKETKIKVISNWDLETYMAVISGSSLFISNSTGPLHIARAFDIPLISFYCPATPCSPRRWGPYNRLDSVIVPDVEPCKTCNPQKCPHGNCLAKIPWRKIESLLDLRIHQIKKE